VAATVPPGANGAGSAGADGAPGVIAVRTEVAREFLIDGLFDDVMRRHPDDLSAEVAAAIEATREAVLDAGDATVGTDLAARISRSGYLARCVETDRFARAREPFPELAEMLAEHGTRSDEGWIAAAGRLSAKLARREPTDKPRPDDARAASWRVPGPGGHVRHFVATRTVRSELARAGAAAPESTPETARDLKRCWMYGFFLRCFEESLPTGSHTSDDQAR